MIIAISGHKQSGKDTVGKIIKYLTYYSKTGFVVPPCETDYKRFLADRDWYNDTDWQIKKFAGKLKECVSIITGFSLEELENEEVKNTIIFTRWFIYHYKLCVDSNPEGRVSEYFATEKDAKEALRDRSSTFLYGCDIKRQDVTIRILLQELGTEVGRSIYSALWIWTTMKDYDANQNWIITDLRFHNELKACKDEKAIIIRVKRDIYNYCDSRIDWNTLCDIVFKDTGEKPTRAYANKNWLVKDDHISETALDNTQLDYTIDNNGSLDELIDNVGRILELEGVI